MKIYDILNKYAVSEIQSYIYDIGRANGKDEKEQLSIFLKGLTYALWDRGFTFELFYSTAFRVEIHKYTDPADCWSSKEHLFNIYSDHIEKVRREEAKG